MKKLVFISIFLFIFMFFITCITTFVVYSNNNFTTSPTEYYFSSDDYFWPLPGYYTISSNFGSRISPTTGASSFHSGIDIPAPEETVIYSSSFGIVSDLIFDGANGYTIKIQNNNYTFSYSHVSPNFIVKIGDYVNKSQAIGNVGSKYILDIPNNPYTDSTRQANKWCYYRFSFTF